MGGKLVQATRRPFAQRNLTQGGCSLLQFSLLGLPFCWSFLLSFAGNQSGWRVTMMVELRKEKNVSGGLGGI